MKKYFLLTIHRKPVLNSWPDSSVEPDSADKGIRKTLSRAAVLIITFNCANYLILL